MGDTASNSPPDGRALNTATVSSPTIIGRSLAPRAVIPSMTSAMALLESSRNCAAKGVTSGSIGNDDRAPTAKASALNLATGVLSRLQYPAAGNDGEPAG